MLSICALSAAPFSEAQSVSISEFPLAPGATPWDITTGPDGALWFTENNVNKIGRITIAGTVSEYVLPTSNSGPLSVTAGPDGALWFTEEAANRIGRITTAGAISEYPVPTSGGQAGGITAGPDGALWFTEFAANKIGRITTTGAITEYPVPTSESEPEGIAAGVDGALWFTEETANKIGRITTAGTFTEYHVPTSKSYPYQITAGPDGALWFTESLADQIGRITTAGTISEYPVPSESNVYGIAASPSGAIWFVEQAANQIGRITTAGAFSEYTAPSPKSYLAGITAGPDGAMWFTEYQSGNIGRAAFLPSLSLTKTHAADFMQGQTNAQYVISVSNNGVGPTSGTITVMDNVPSGLALVSMSGSGWSCSSFTCTRNDVLAIGSSFPTITVIVSAAASAPSTVTNQATVSGGGSIPGAASDLTNIGQSVCSYSFPGSPASVGPGTSQGSAALATNPTNCPYTSVVSNNPDWITVTNGLSGVGSNTIGYSITAVNNTGAPRAGSFTLLNANQAVATFMIVQAAASSVTNVTSSTANGTYLTGQSISLHLTWSAAVKVTGNPQLALNSGGTANYSSGSVSNTLNFIYTLGGGDNSAHLDDISAGSLTLNGGTITDANLNNAILTLPTPGAAGSLGANTSIVIGNGTAAYFTGEVSLGSDVYYLQFPNGNLFGYYSLRSFPILYHYDLGFESFIDAHDGNAGAYLYDFASGHWFYTSPNLFPYLYDFTLSGWLYYFPDPDNKGHYSTNPRYFSDLGTGKIFPM